MQSGNNKVGIEYSYKNVDRTEKRNTPLDKGESEWNELGIIKKIEFKMQNISKNNKNIFNINIYF